MKCHGIDIASKERLELSFSEVIEAADPLIGRRDDLDYLAPGFIDLQVNGFAGVDYNSPVAPHEEIARSLDALFATGVTRFFPTVITGDPEEMTGALHNLVRARESLADGKAMEGFHVEGPFISPDDGPRGAHPRRWVRPPDIEEFRRFQDAAEGHVRLITLSPEWPEAPRFIETVTGEGVVASIGHTKATSDQLRDAVNAGATLSTHIGNGAHAVLPRHPNYLWEQLAEDRLAASLIVDGIHLPESFLRVAIRAKGADRAVLVTDAVMTAGCEPGIYKLGEVDVELHSDGSVRLLGGTRLAGSALKMNDAIANVMRIARISLNEAITLATKNPARVGRIASRQRGLVPGDRADIVRFRVVEETGRIEVLETWFAGR